MKQLKYFQIAFLVIGVLAALEFIFVRGMFTWLIAVAAVSIVGVLNVIVNIMQREWLQVCLYVLCTVSLCMGYFVLA